jgi:arsenate reductase
LTDKPTVLFVCGHNAGRSQMAAALLNKYGAGRVQVLSAGSAPADEVNAAVIDVMRDVGIDLTAETPKLLSTEAVQASDVVITMGCGDACPIFPASATWTGSWKTPPDRASTPSGPSATTSTSASRHCSPTWYPPPPDPPTPSASVSRTIARRPLRSDGCGWRLDEP